jgi:hypothetical protein
VAALKNEAPLRPVVLPLRFRRCDPNSIRAFVDGDIERRHGSVCEVGGAAASDTRAYNCEPHMYTAEAYALDKLLEEVL